MVATINPDASVIPDDAEVWIQSKASVDSAGGISSCTPASISDDLEALGWQYVGLIDAGNGIPFEPDGEVNEFDGFGHPAYRKKFTKGKVNTGFTCLEDNAVTAGIVLPGSTSNKLGAPRDLQFYVLYRVVDEGYSERILVSTRNALMELTSHSGYVEGEQTSYEFTVHHSGDQLKDVFTKIGGVITTPVVPVVKVFTIESGVTAYTATVDGQTSASITTLTAAALRSALEALSNVGSGNVSVTGSTGGPLTATFDVPVSVVSASGTGGTVTVA